MGSFFCSCLFLLSVLKVGWNDANLCSKDAQGVGDIFCGKLSTALMSSWSFTILTTLQLLSILGIGFAQGLYAIDAADGETEHGSLVVNALIQALLQFVFVSWTFWKH